MYTIRKTYKIEYAHQLKSSFTAGCHETIHGHSGVVELFFKSNQLNRDDMVIDFGEVSHLIKNIVMNLDHALIMPESLDKKYLNMLCKHNKKLILVPFNPTAEKFAEWLYKSIDAVLSKKKILLLQSVRFHETETGYAEYTRF